MSPNQFLNLQSPGYQQGWTNILQVYLPYVSHFLETACSHPLPHDSSGWGSFPYCSAGIFIYYGNKSFVYIYVANIFYPKWSFVFWATICSSLGLMTFLKLRNRRWGEGGVAKRKGDLPDLTPFCSHQPWVHFVTSLLVVLSFPRSYHQ